VLLPWSPHPLLPLPWHPQNLRRPSTLHLPSSSRPPVVSTPTVLLFLLPLLNQGPFFNPVLLVSGPVKICTNDSWVHCIDVKIPEEVYFGLPAQGRVHVPFYKYQKQKSLTHRRMRKKILIRREVNRIILHCNEARDLIFDVSTRVTENLS
jgi:hypothetical protein